MLYIFKMLKSILVLRVRLICSISSQETKEAPRATLQAALPAHHALQRLPGGPRATTHSHNAGRRLGQHMDDQRHIVARLVGAGGSTEHNQQLVVARRLHEWNVGTDQLRWIDHGAATVRLVAIDFDIDRSGDMHYFDDWRKYIGVARVYCRSQYTAAEQLFYCISGCDGYANRWVYGMGRFSPRYNLLHIHFLLDTDNCYSNLINLLIKLTKFPMCRHCLDAVLHRLRAEGLLASWSASVWSVAVRRLHGVPRFTVHGSTDHSRPLLLGQNCGQISELAHQEQGHLDGDHNVDRTGHVVLHIDLWLGTLSWLSGFAARSVCRAVPQGSRF